MPTRAIIIVEDDEFAIQIYKQYDGYPDGKSGILEKLRKSADLAWDLPRTEAPDFSAAIVATMKDSAGDVYIEGSPTDEYNPVVSYTYYITPEKGKWKIEVYKGSGTDGDPVKEGYIE